MKKIISLLVIMLFVFQRALDSEAGEQMMKIKIVFDENVVIGELNGSAPAKDLLKKLPLTLNMSLHQNREYYASILLDKNGKAQDGYQIGDIGYWTPGNSLVFFYGKGYSDSLIIMGQIISGIEFLPEMGYGSSVHIEVLENEKGI